MYPLCEVVGEVDEFGVVDADVVVPRVLEHDCVVLCVEQCLQRIVSVVVPDEDVELHGEYVDDCEEDVHYCVHDGVRHVWRSLSADRRDHNAEELLDELLDDVGGELEAGELAEVTGELVEYLGEEEEV